VTRVLASFSPLSYGPLMTEPDPELTLADPDDLSNSLSFALRFEGKRRYNDSDRFAADIIADRLVRHLDRCGTSSTRCGAGVQPRSVVHLNGPPQRAAVDGLHVLADSP
jgi:hypothetical protein